MTNWFLFILGIIFLIIYFLPLIKSKMNEGIIFGLSVGTSFVLIGLIFDLLLRSNIIAMLIYLYFFALLVFYLAVLFLYKSSKTTSKYEKVVIVLGCRVKGDIPSRALKERCKVAINHLKQNKSAVAILSGGQGKDELITEAECMRRIFIEQGIEEDRIYIEDKSTSTKENLDFSLDIISEHKLPNDVAIATNDYHIYRSCLLAKDLGIEATALSAKSIPVLRFSYYTREVIALIYRIYKRARG